MMQSIKELLSEHPFFRDLSAGQIELIAGCGSNRHIKKDEVLFREGEQADYFYVIRKGRIVVEIDGAERGVIRIQTVEKGDVLGWSWLIPPHNWRFKAVALEESSIISLDGKCLRGKCHSDHELGYELLHRLAEVLAQRLERTRMQILDVYGEHK